MHVCLHCLDFDLEGPGSTHGGKNKIGREEEKRKEKFEDSNHHDLATK